MKIKVSTRSYLVVIKNKYIHTQTLVMYSLNFISEYVALSYNFDYTTLKEGHTLYLIFLSQSQS